MGQGCPGKPNIETGGGHFQFIHIGNKLKALVGNKQAENNPEEIKKAGAVRVTPFFNIGNNTHTCNRLVYTKFKKCLAKGQCRLLISFFTENKKTRAVNPGLFNSYSEILIIVPIKIFSESTATPVSAGSIGAWPGLVNHQVFAHKIGTV